MLSRPHRHRGLTLYLAALQPAAATRRAGSNSRKRGSPTSAIHLRSPRRIALVLTISGIYGVLAYAVARRTKEIGIRMALGESAAGVVGLILKQSMRRCAR